MVDTNGQTEGVQPEQTKQPDPETPATTSAPAPEAPPAPEMVSIEHLAKLEAALAITSKELDELKDRFLRAQAEWDNSRKRILREKEEAVRYAGENLLEKMLPILDNFEMGMGAAKTATEAKSIAMGLEMVLSQFQQAVKDMGVEVIEAVGKPFDPHRHEALGHQVSLDVPEGTVLSQLRKGYKLRDRLLRAASVFVAKAPGSEE